MRSALAYRKKSLLRAFGKAIAIGIRNCRRVSMRSAPAPASGFYIRSALARQRVYIRSALAYPKRPLLCAVGSGNGVWHTRLETHLLIFNKMGAFFAAEPQKTELSATIKTQSVFIPLQSLAQGSTLSVKPEG
jgi:hypothetical protein